ncbi:MAG: DUF4382 domain-containing protein [Thermodesulfobacteriota bacterium]
MRHFGFAKLFVAALFIVALTALSVDVSEARRDGHDKGHHGIEGEANSLVVKYTKAVVKPENGKRLVFSFDPPREVDLLALGPDASLDILDDYLPEGRYKSISLKVLADKDTFDSYIDISGTDYSIWMPNGKKGHHKNKRGLKLDRGFDVTSGGTADFSVRFDLSKDVHKAKRDDDNVILKPRLRLMDSVIVEPDVVPDVVIEPGTLSGLVNLSLLRGDECTGGFVVYLYSGAGVVPDDMDGDSGDAALRTNVFYDSSQYSFAYAFDSVDPGDYTAAFTCQGYDDFDDSDELIVFKSVVDVSVASGVDSFQDLN